MTVQLAPSTDHNAESTTSQHASDQARQLWRFWFIVICFLLMTGLVVLRLLDYQIIQWGGTARGAAVDAPAARGVIVDRDGELLAGDRYFYRIAATPNLITAEQHPVIADLLQQLTGPARAGYVQHADGNGGQSVCRARTRRQSGTGTENSGLARRKIYRTAWADHRASGRFRARLHRADAAALLPAGRSRQPPARLCLQRHRSRGAQRPGALLRRLSA